jgi:hypothetical protein
MAGASRDLKWDNPAFGAWSPSWEEPMGRTSGNVHLGQKIATARFHLALAMLTD